MHSRRILRVVATVLLVWIAADLAALDTCGLDIEHQASAALPTVAGVGHDDGGAFPHVLFHPDHCFCHGLSTGADTAAAMIVPLFISRAVPAVTEGQVSRLSSTLDHPPQPAA
jgi:hypothetical protein